MSVAGAHLLETESVVAGYVPDLPIVHGVSLGVATGEILVILGPNGAGKSTLVKSLAGVVPMFGGQVRLAGEEITGTPAHRLSARGVGFVPQTGNVFTSLTVDENLRIGGYLLKSGLREQLDAAYARFPDLAQRRRHAGHALSGGQRQMLAIARALMTAPRLLLLDEPSAGLSPLMVSEVFAQVRKIADSGIAVLMVEQNVKAGLRIADRGLILVNGRAAHTGAAAQLSNDPLIAQLYLGKHAAPLAAHAAAGVAS
ncbi:ABC transporter ATP-binding protein [Variovorax sp. J22P240]|uniref:ABC transporter ATP-binding protein n=1 Tax=Variovorax sp. J22P240 TaxID=3053514 RepID=UPI002576BB3C|nr:ABC transporter ATP-binding protein [Variovorax sp. J22P240]MDM0002963.1 ABC transporter ATP-binding protein [Variovorax sp. J22P240]